MSAILIFTRKLVELHDSNEKALVTYDKDFKEDKVYTWSDYVRKSVTFANYLSDLIFNLYWQTVNEIAHIFFIILNRIFYFLY